LKSGVGDIVKGLGDRQDLQTKGVTIMAKAGKVDEVVSVTTFADK
jgi:hypothetical protein